MKTIEIRIAEEYFLRGFKDLISPYTFGVGINSEEVAEQVLAYMMGWTE